jgi:hypothetical protein
MEGGCSFSATFAGQSSAPDSHLVVVTGTQINHDMFVSGSSKTRTQGKGQPNAVEESDLQHLHSPVKEHQGARVVQLVHLQRTITQVSPVLCNRILPGLSLTLLKSGTFVMSTIRVRETPISKVVLITPRHQTLTHPGR